VPLLATPTLVPAGQQDAVFDRIGRAGRLRVGYGVHHARTVLRVQTPQERIEVCGLEGQLELVVAITEPAEQLADVAIGGVTAGF
jgi:hypothetical protein